MKFLVRFITAIVVVTGLGCLAFILSTRNEPATEPITQIVTIRAEPSTTPRPQRTHIVTPPTIILHQNTQPDFADLLIPPAVPAVTLPSDTPTATEEHAVTPELPYRTADVDLSGARALTVTATAYTTERQAHKTTATGTTARVGAIAVDPNVIPYGTRMYITSKIEDNGGSPLWVYGYAAAEDCGSAIKGNKIDLFFDTYDECINFGRRTAIVYFID